MMYYNSKTNELTNVAPWGNHFYDDEIKAELFADWTEVADNFVPVAPVPTKSEKLIALDAEYQPQFKQLAEALGLATLDGIQSVIDGVKNDYESLKSEYQTKMEAINNG